METTPLRKKKNSGNFKTHTLKKLRTNVWSYQISSSLLIFCSIFFAMGIGIVAAVIIHFHTKLLTATPLALITFGTSFIFFGLIILKEGLPKMVLNLGLKKIILSQQNIINFENILSLQLLASDVEIEQYIAYGIGEINLVLIDQSRINIIAHGNLQALREDAKILAQLIDIELKEII